jgi:hypothetical protein
MFIYCYFIRLYYIFEFEIIIIFIFFAFFAFLIFYMFLYFMINCDGIFILYHTDNFDVHQLTQMTGLT